MAKIIISQEQVFERVKGEIQAAHITISTFRSFLDITENMEKAFRDIWNMAWKNVLETI